MATSRQAQQAAEQHADVLSAYPNVVGVGTRPDATAAAPPGGGHAVAVYVSHTVPADRLRADERLPTSVELATGDATTTVPVVVVEVGAFTREIDDAAPRDDFTSD